MHILHVYVDRLKLETAFYCSALFLEAESLSQLQTTPIWLFFFSLLSESPLFSETKIIRKTQCLPMGVRDLNIGP